MITRARKFKRTICKIVGHDLKENKCTRCKKIFPLPFTAYELVGMVIYNSAGVVKINVSE